MRRGPKLLEASAGRWGLLGSPAFHVILALLFAVIALGRLTRGEGIIGIPLGTTVADQAASYGTVAQGPLYLGHSGLDLGASDLVFDYRDSQGVARGTSALVSIYRAGRLVAQGHVYPNAPLRYGSLLLHPSGYGIAASFALVAKDGSVAETATTLVDFDASRPAGTTPGVLDLTGADGAVRYQVAVDVPADESGGQVVERLPARPEVEASLVGTGTPRQVLLRPGGEMLLPEGDRIRFIDLRYYARLTVSDDWSIYPMYLLFLLAGIAVSVSVLVPYRTVRVLLVEGPDGAGLHAVITHRRGDPLFTERIETALSKAAGSEPAKNEESS